MATPRVLRYLFLLLLFCLLSVVSASASQGSIFVYHRFGDARYPSTNIELKVFAAQLDYLIEQRIPVLPLSQVVTRLRRGAELPERYVVLTVDDGYASFLSGAMPLLRQRQLPVTLFVSSRSVGARGYLDWEQLRILQREGVEVGNHSHSHPHLVNLFLEGGEVAVRRELESSQALFEQQLGVRPRLFAYPFGETLPAISRMVEASDFLGATVQHSGVVTETSDLWHLPRFAMGGAYATLVGFKEKSRMSALPVTVESPSDGVIGRCNPPELVLRLAAEASVGVSQFNCFVAGRRDCRIEPLDGHQGRFRMVSDHPLKGRRNRYTLTAQDTHGRWFWYSWLWFDLSARE